MFRRQQAFVLGEEEQELDGNIWEAFFRNVYVQTMLVFNVKSGQGADVATIEVCLVLVNVRDLPSTKPVEVLDEIDSLPHIRLGIYSLPE